LGPVFRHLRPYVYSRHYFEMAGHAYDRGQMKTAREYLLKARTYPASPFNRLRRRWLSLYTRTWMPIPLLEQARLAKRRLLGAALPRTVPGYSQEGGK